MQLANRTLQEMRSKETIAAVYTNTERYYRTIIDTLTHVPLKGGRLWNPMVSNTWRPKPWGPNSDPDDETLELAYMRYQHNNLLLIWAYLFNRRLSQSAEARAVQSYLPPTSTRWGNVEEAPLTDQAIMEYTMEQWDFLANLWPEVNFPIYADTVVLKRKHYQKMIGAFVE